MRVPVGMAMALIVIAASIYSFSPRHVLPLQDSSIPVDRMQLTTIERSKAGLIVAGELGSILVSADEGKTWKAATLSNERQALITRIIFVDDQLGLALGHEGWILRTEDGGLNWTETNFSESNGEPLMSAARLPSGDWLALGAFGQVLRSTDNAKSWQADSLPGLTDWHLNDISSSADGQHWLIVGEAGTAVRSADGGQTWETIEPFYNGSLYGAVSLGAGHWVTYGMRGHVFTSADDGLSWQETKVPAPISLYGHAVLPDGELLLVGQGGMVLSSKDGGKTLEIASREGRASLTDIVVGATISALLLALVLQMYKRLGTIDPQRVKPLHK